MDDDALRDRIVVDPGVCGGRPCIRGHRIWVATVLSLLANGMTIAQVLEEYPQLNEADVRAALAFASRLSAGGFVELAQIG